MSRQETSLLLAAVPAALLCAGCYNVAAPDLTDGGVQGDPAGVEDDSMEGLYWHLIKGGVFEMGDEGILWSEPEHLVDVLDFELTRTEITVGQYRQCFDAGECPEPQLDEAGCNWSGTGMDDHPVNCVSWQSAVDFCEWIGGRLPSEAEWEFAARGEAEHSYPWGEEEATCDRAVMDGAGGFGCGQNATWAVCSRPDGDNPQGLCDMAGNVGEWVQDWFHDSYIGAPTDGSSWEYPVGYQRVVRGGAFRYNSYQLLSAKRYHSAADVLVGFRCAR